MVGGVGCAPVHTHTHSMLFLLALAAPRDYYICNFTCPSNESWSACRSERCSAPALPEDLCSGGEEPAASAELVAGPGACEAYAVDAGSFKERCGICTALSRAALAAATSGAAEEDAALCAAAASATAASELPPLRTCRLDPSACASLLEQLQEATCPHAAQMIRAGASRAAVLWKARAHHTRPRPTAASRLDGPASPAHARAAGEVLGR